MSPWITIDHVRIADFCHRWQVAELALFGSVVGEAFDPDRSDVDVLIEFLPGVRVGLMALSRMRRDLVEIFGREVDLVPKQGLKPIIRDEVLASAQVVHAEAA